MKKIPAAFLIICTFLFPLHSAEKNKFSKDDACALAEQISAGFVASAFVAQKWVQGQDGDSNEVPRKVVWAKALLDFARLSNGVIVLFNQHYGRKNLGSFCGGYVERVRKYTSIWVTIDAIKCFLNFLPEHWLDSISKDFEEVPFFGAYEGKLYSFFENNSAIKKIRSYALPGVELGTMFVSAWNPSGVHCSIREQKKILYVAAVKGLSRSVQEFCDAKTVWFKRFFLGLAVMHLIFLSRDIIDFPYPIVEGTCSICLDDCDEQKKVKDIVHPECGHTCCRDCLQKWFDQPREPKNEVLTAEQLRSEQLRRKDLAPRLRNGAFLNLLDKCARDLETDKLKICYGERSVNQSSCPLCRKCLDRGTFQIKDFHSWFKEVYLLDLQKLSPRKLFSIVAQSCRLDKLVRIVNNAPENLDLQSIVKSKKFDDYCKSMNDIDQQLLLALLAEVFNAQGN